jgi:hypothetical protein
VSLLSAGRDEAWMSVLWTIVNGIGLGAALRVPFRQTHELMMEPRIRVLLLELETCYGIGAIVH